MEPGRRPPNRDRHQRRDHLLGRGRRGVDGRRNYNRERDNAFGRRHADGPRLGGRAGPGADVRWRRRGALLGPGAAGGVPNVRGPGELHAGAAAGEPVHGVGLANRAERKLDADAAGAVERDGAGSVAEEHGDHERDGDDGSLADNGDPGRERRARLGRNAAGRQRALPERRHPLGRAVGEHHIRDTRIKYDNFP